MNRSLHHTLLLALLLMSCQQGKQENKPPGEATIGGETVKPSLSINLLKQYDFSHPAEVIKLPKELKEVSGIRFINDSMLVMISDSKPDIFFYNIRQEAIVKQIRVGSRGDFEDIAVSGERIFVIQSNGVLWTVGQYNESPTLTADSLPLQQPFEIEGLSTNKKGDSLFLAAKYWHQDDLVPSGMLPVWGWSLSEKKRSEKPILLVPDKVSSSKGQQEFHTSGILPVYPEGRWLLISTNNKFIVQMNTAGQVDTLIKLDEDVFVKPEGIAFSPDGNLYISNEGKYDKATLLAFKKIN